MTGQHGQNVPGNVEQENNLDRKLFHPETKVSNSGYVREEF